MPNIIEMQKRQGLVLSSKKKKLKKIVLFGLTNFRWTADIEKNVFTPNVLEMHTKIFLKKSIFWDEKFCIQFTIPARKFSDSKKIVIFSIFFWDNQNQKKYFCVKCLKNAWNVEIWCYIKKNPKKTFFCDLKVFGKLSK